MKIAAPNRVSRSYTQSLCARPEVVFPLLCPVRETEWVNGWNPSLVLSASGFAEPDCVFITPGVPEDPLWVVTVHEPEAFHLEILKLIPGVVLGKISIRLAQHGEDACTANITYTYTSLSTYGNEALKEFTEDYFRLFMETWEGELNHFLKTGSRLERDGGN